MNEDIPVTKIPLTKPVVYSYECFNTFFQDPLYDGPLIVIVLFL